MTPVPLTLTRAPVASRSPLQTATVDASAISVLTAPSAGKTDKAAKAAAAALALGDPARARRQALKDQAYKQVHALVERLKALKQYASDDPKLMAKSLAGLVKELKAALKAYIDAGGTPPVMATPSAPAAPKPPPADDAAPDPAADPAPADATPADASAVVPVDPTAATDAAKAKAVETEAEGKAFDDAAAEARGSGPYQKMRDAVSGSEAVGDMTFLKDVKGIVKAVRDLLTKARIQTAIKGPDDETKAAFKATDDGLKEVDELAHDLDHDIRSSSPEAGLFIALWA